MQFVPKQQRLAADQRDSVAVADQLDPQQRQTLLSFAAFLSSREDVDNAPEVEKTHEPKQIARPQEESVVKAIKRLSESYFMLERGLLLDETSSLMVVHMSLGREARLVIDEL